MLKKLWHDPVWSKVIAGIILAFGAVAIAYVLDLGPTIIRSLREWSQVLGASTPVPNWLLVVLALLALPVIIVLIIVLLPAVPILGSAIQVSGAGSASPSWRAYTSDDFIGLHWRWTYFGDGTINTLASSAHAATSRSLLRMSATFVRFPPSDSTATAAMLRSRRSTSRCPCCTAK
jgi:hypothetical protein